MDAYIEQSFQVNFTYRVHFTQNLFSQDNPLLKEALQVGSAPAYSTKILFVLDSGVRQAFPALWGNIQAYFNTCEGHTLIPEYVELQGGEESKNDMQYVQKLLQALNVHGIDRHSYLVAIGGGSVLDASGWAAAMAHRGLRHIRIPTTVLAQNDSGVGVKNGVNYFGKKNFLGSFAPPFAVINDTHFLHTLPDRQWIAGIPEAIKVALIKDAAFFDWIESHAAALAQRDMPAMEYLIARCARLHMAHIASGDPFELGSSRPLDFGHWSAHKLEQLSNFSLLHGEAVALGIALDSTYSHLKGLLAADKLGRILDLLIRLGLPIHHPLLRIEDEQAPLLAGKREFREHLGGRLTVMLLEDIGIGLEVHELQDTLLQKAADYLNAYVTSEKIS